MFSLKKENVEILPNMSNAATRPVGVGLEKLSSKSNTRQHAQIQQLNLIDKVFNILTVSFNAC